MTVPFLDLGAQYRDIKSELDAAVGKVMASGRYVLGPNVEAFEWEIADLCGADYAVGVASGTDALVLALRTMGVNGKREVITTPFSYVATAAAIVRAGLWPVFVDIDPDTFNLDPCQVKKAITRKTAAILPVHLYGQPADMEPLTDIAGRYDLPMIVDAAQAIGAAYQELPLGYWGTAQVLSFYPTKNLGAMGDGGMLVTDDPAIADRVRILAQQGERRRYRCEAVGLNSRLDELQAAILRVKLGYLWAWTLRRREIAREYDTAFAGLPLQTPAVLDDALHVYHQYTIRTPHRDELRAALAAQDIGTGVYYPEPLHLQPAFVEYGNGVDSLPHAEQASREVLSLPVWPEMTEAQVCAVVDAIKRFYDA